MYALECLMLCVQQVLGLTEEALCIQQTCHIANAEMWYLEALMVLQVLSLESKVAEYQQQQAAQQKQLERSKLEAQHAQRALRAAQQDASAGPSDGPFAGAVRNSPRATLPDQAPPRMLDTDSWAEPASVEVSINTQVTQLQQ